MDRGQFMWASTLLKVQAASGIFKFKLFALRFWPSKATQNTIFISQSKLKKKENKLKVFWVVKNILGITKNNFLKTPKI